MLRTVRLYDVLLLLVTFHGSSAASLHPVGGILISVDRDEGHLTVQVQAGESLCSYGSASVGEAFWFRKPGLPDTLFPSVCPPLCSQLFHAEDAKFNNSHNDRCTCVCPSSAPIYLNTAGYCVDRLDECRHNLVFNTTIATERLIPVVSLPAKNGVLHPKVPIQWEEGGITVSPLGNVDCAVSAVFFDNMDHRWRATTRRTLFDISTAHGRPAVMFLGTDSDVAILTGAVVQLKLSCAGFAPDEYCLSFRVTGVSGDNPYLLPSSNTKAELVFILVLAFLLALTITGSFAVWHLCWRIKKRQLISDIQMQFLYQLQQQQEAMKVAAAHAAATEMGPCEFKTPLERIPKRRLYFSSEYLDEAMMANPPPVAEQFLADLRRVIELARERIRMRRFVPMLITIPEDHEEGRSTVTQVSDPEQNERHVNNQQESPKSDKSVDSGRESRSDSDDSSKEDDEDVQEEEQQSAEVAQTMSSVRNIVNGFESRSAHVTPVPQPSRVSPQIFCKPRLPNSQIPILLGESSPRPLQKSLSRVPSLPKTSPPRIVSDSRARRGYAVFPADPMLNKSLPRRKRAIPRLVGDSSSTASSS